MDVPYSPIPELNLLRAFQERTGFEEYAEGFGLSEYGDQACLKAGWSEDPAFLARLVPFAQANCSGSVYALWRVDDQPDNAGLPVVVFGDEGGQHVVARNVRELLQLLGYGPEISVDHDQAYFYLDDDWYEPRAYHHDYVAWLAEQFGLAPAADPDQVIARAQEELGRQFASWASGFLAD